MTAKRLRAVLIAAPLKIVRGSGRPVRALALVPAA